MRLLVLLVVAVAAALCFLLPDFFSARHKPSGFEAAVVRKLRTLSIPKAIRDRRNPIALSDQLLTDARAHFADHCAVCHGNDGRGRTEMGPNFSPPTPDLTSVEIQSLSDGQLYYAIRNGVRFSGMPAWGSDSEEDERANWELVHFIRHLPTISKRELDEMKRFNPQSPQELEEDEAEEKFLEGGEAPPAHHH
jgi:mono/diheme cytochrome c family protein